MRATFGSDGKWQLEHRRGGGWRTGGSNQADEGEDEETTKART